MQKTGKLELTWVGKYEEKVVEPRILVEDKSKSYGDPDTGNMLIHGDNLIALKALEQDFANKIKCIYIDPPYNTGYAFENYDDGVEHSIWLSIMKERLLLLKNLLAEDGVIVVQIGYDEMAYLKLLLDEIFGRYNCLGQIAVRMSHSAGMKRKAMEKRFIKNTEYIFYYYKDKLPTITPLYEICYEYPVNYYQYIQSFPSAKECGKYVPLIDILYSEFENEFNKYSLSKTNKSIRDLYSFNSNIREFIIKNKERIVRKDSNAPQVDKSKFPNLCEDEFIQYNTLNDTYYLGINSNGNIYQIYSLIDKIKEIEDIDENGNVFKTEAVTNLIGDWWDGFYKDMSRVDMEGGVKMKTSKKPERLIKWILTSVTNLGDIVLDSFLGSGTTCAVAHKMGRKWIGIEMGEHAYTLSKIRMDNVINGDQTGISKVVSWKGGGGYKFYELAPSLLEKHQELPIYTVNKFYTFEMLCEAICKLEGFRYHPEGEMHGNSSETRFIHIAKDYVSADYVMNLLKNMGEKDSVLIYGTKIQSRMRLPDSVVVKKIPKDLLDKCVFESEVR